LFLKLHGVVRPLSLKTDVLKKRNRSSTSPRPINKKRPAVQHVSAKAHTGGWEKQPEAGGGAGLLVKQDPPHREARKTSEPGVVVLEPTSHEATSERYAQSQHVHGICQDIYDNLLPHITQVDRHSITEILTTLIYGLSATLRDIPMRPSLSMGGYIKAFQRYILSQATALQF
jgi:hypothetical protein